MTRWVCPVILALATCSISWFFMSRKLLLVLKFIIASSIFEEMYNESYGEKFSRRRKIFQIL
jgi:hypothetical protein